ncbi:MAG: globin [Adhaeribacter sp.]|jgi:hemoglobin|nr:globin [Adhaeribacter sp.]
MVMKHDISGLEDIKLMVDDFYEKVAEDELLAPIFNFRLSTYWVPHLEKMYTFWNAALFGVKGYMGNPFAKHATMPVTDEHFERWLRLFNATVDTHFAGPMAEEAKRRGLIMATTFSRRIQNNQGNEQLTLV